MMTATQIPAIVPELTDDFCCIPLNTKQQLCNFKEIYQQLDCTLGNKGRKQIIIYIPAGRSNCIEFFSQYMYISSTSFM
jgi:hypothetical protein